MGLLKNVKTTTKVESTVEDDRLGGGRQLLNSDVYNFTIKGFYLDKAASGALCAVIDFENDDGKSIRVTEYFTNKAGENYFTKDDKSHFLPGFLKLDALCILVNETPFFEQEFEDKHVQVYDRELQKEVPQKREVAVSMLGQQVKAGVIRQIVDVTKKNETTGKYEPNGETREENIIDKFFHIETEQTLKEAEQGVEGGVFMQEWLAKYKDQIPNKAKGVTTGSTPVGRTGAPAQQGAAPAKKSLFNK